MTTAETPYLKYALYNAAVVVADELKVSPLGSGFMAGEGLFETIRVANSRPVLFDSHYARLAASLRSLDEIPSSSRGELHTRCIRVIAANSLVNGSLKIVVFKEAAGWTELILARQPKYGPADYERGFQLKTFAGDLRIDPLNTLKSLNYLRNSYAKRTAVAAGFDEALFIDPNRKVLEGASTNIFIVKDCVISTPPLGSGILPGVMRAAIINRLESRVVRERELSLNELQQADEVFVTNALLGIMPVARIDAIDYDLTSNAITRSLMSVLTKQPE
jgi:branched-subunit amino acid aminotransferase/4-amino-4-deoxychorismate lyase